MLVVRGRLHLKVMEDQPIPFHQIITIQIRKEVHQTHSHNLKLLMLHHLVTKDRNKVLGTHQIIRHLIHMDLPINIMGVHLKDLLCQAAGRGHQGVTLQVQQPNHLHLLAEHQAHHPMKRNSLTRTSWIN